MTDNLQDENEGRQDVCVFGFSYFASVSVFVCAAIVPCIVLFSTFSFLVLRGFPRTNALVVKAPCTVNEISSPEPT